MQKVFSHSSLSAFETCPKKYSFRYIEKVPARSESIEGFLGKRVHEILERLHVFVHEGRVPSLERVLYRYRCNWAEVFDPERIRVVREELDAEFYLGAGERCLSNYYRGHYPFDRGETLGLEKAVRVSLDARGDYAVRGVIDRLSRAPDGALEIHDYKTGRYVPKQAALDRDRQLALYEIAVREQLRETGEVRLVWHFLLSNQTRTSMRTPEQLDELREATREAIDRVRSETAWEPKPGKLCDWCEYREICPAFGRPVEAAPEPARAPEPLPDELAYQLSLL